MMDQMKNQASKSQTVERVDMSETKSENDGQRLFRYFVYIVTEHYAYLSGEVIGVFEEHEMALDLIQDKVKKKTNADWFTIGIWPIGGREAFSDETYDNTGNCISRRSRILGEN